MLVLGIGNRLMMDDGIGVYIVEELMQRNTNFGIRYVIGETDIYYCLSQIEEYAYIIIVDAAYLDKEPGAISVIPLELTFKNQIQPISVHDSHLLNEIKRMGKYTDGVFIGIEPYKVTYCPNLSTNLQEQLEIIVQEIESIISTFSDKKIALSQ